MKKKVNIIKMNVTTGIGCSQITRQILNELKEEFNYYTYDEVIQELIKIYEQSK